MTYAYVPAEGLDTVRRMTAYRVPAVSVGGLLKFAVKKPAAPLEKPAMVATARSAPVGTAGLPLVALIETVMFGIVPVQALQKRSTSALVNWPLTSGVKVWPAQLVLLKPKPLLVTERFCWSMDAEFNSVTAPGLPVRSQLVAIPVWKSAWVVSVKQLLVGAALSEKSRVVASKSVTAMLTNVCEV